MDGSRTRDAVDGWGRIREGPDGWDAAPGFMGGCSDRTRRGALLLPAAGLNELDKRVDGIVFVGPDG